MLDYKSIKEYFTKFYADAFEDAKKFWKDYAKAVEEFYNKNNSYKTISYKK
jgi:hypothetical protein